MVLSDRAIALTRRPVKDKGALMQTLHLWFRALRAISLGQSPGRWPSPSLRTAATWKGALPLPSLGSARSAAKLSPGEFPRSCFTHPSPTSAVGSRPAMSRQRLARCPTVGAGLPLASPLREVRVGASAHPGKPDGADTNRVYPRQTASDLSPYPAPHEAGDLGADHWQARASESRWLASSGLSFPLGARRFRAHSCGEKAADPIANVMASARISSGAWARLHHSRGEGAWPATTSL